TNHLDMNQAAGWPTRPAATGAWLDPCLVGSLGSMPPPGHPWFCAPRQRNRACQAGPTLAFADPRGARLPRRTSTMEAPQTLITVMRHAVGRPSLVFRCCGPPPGTAAIAAKAAYLRGTVSSKPRR